MKCLVKLKKQILTECFQLLKEVYGDNIMSLKQVFEWHKRFMEGREEVEDDESMGRPSASKTEENVEKIREIFGMRVRWLIKSTTWRY
jgi:hypothetical protein